MSSPRLNAHMIVDEVQEKYPQTVRVFQKYAEACVGCTLGPFCTLAEAAQEYDLSISQFLEALQQSIEASDET